MITRGSTLTQSFALTFDVDQISELFITYVQQGRKILEKTKKDIYVNRKTNVVKVLLTQDDTLAFRPTERGDESDSSIVFIQIRALLMNGSSLVSSVMRARVYDSLKDDVIYEESVEIPNDGIIIYDGGDVGGYR